ncbi:CHAT domain-containing tetratricopeptide repeat protein [Rhodanobacter sp. C03]|uniref:CHAT domain-containing protein n=1 Tax=Rhodanobacter sp. C03 TaxID=1945858 RepID=UPI001C2C5107|nr:CHAT domain-containing tetratricopeptide repeat protein [Rhodanobacter sp. C03]
MRAQLILIRLATAIITILAGNLAAQDLPALRSHDAAAIDTSTALNAQARMDDADTALALSADGALLYGASPLKMDGYQYCSLAVALSEKGELRQSVRAASQALYLAQQSKDSELLARAYRDLAIVYGYGGDYDKAVAFANAALKQTVKDPTQIVGPAHKVLGDAAARQGDYNGAIAEYRLALPGSSDHYRPLVQLSLVNALIGSGDLASARTELGSLKIAATDTLLSTELKRTEAKLLLAEKKPADALVLYRELEHSASGDDGGYQRFWAEDGIARSQLAMGDKAQAAATWTQALDGLDQVRAQFRSEEFKIGLFSDVQSVFAQAIDLYSQMGDSATAFDLSERSRSRALLDEVRDRAKLAPGVASTIPVAELQKQLHADERVVEFHSLPDRLLVWVVGDDGLREQSYPIPHKDLIRLVDAFRQSIIAGRRSAVGAAEQLGELLIKPLNLPLNARLIVVPHGPLHYLPFQALRVDGHYLIEQHPISVTPSISIAMQLIRRGTVMNGSLTAFGNPDVAPQYALPGSEAEVKALAAAFPGTQLFLHDQATKSRFEASAGKTSLIHVAAHAQADTIDPLYSRILLANENGKVDFLEAHEVLGLNLDKVSLVTLSACESGLGRVADGDEVLGFTRSFLSAGSSGLIVSLWPVSDDATKLLMSTLYGELAKGSDVQVAMQRAQLAVLHTKGMDHPFFWAPFDVIGDWRLTVGAKP